MWFIAVVLLAVGAPIAQATPGNPHPGVGLRIEQIPVAQKDDPRALVSIVETVRAGAKVTRELVVQNRTGDARSIEIYAGAAKIEPVAGFTYAEGKPQNELTKWTTIDKPVVDLADETETTVNVTFAPPKNAPEGEIYAVIWAQVSSAPSDAGGPGVAVVNRVGIPVFFAVGDGTAKPSFRIYSLTPRKNSSETHDVLAHVVNDGNRAVNLNGTATLSGGPGGLSVPPKAATTLTLAPGTEGDVIFPMGAALPAGPWDINVKLKAGLVEHEASGTLTFPESGLGQSIQIEHGTAPWIWGVLGAAVMAIIAGIIFFVIWRRRSRHSPSGTETIEPSS